MSQIERRQFITEALADFFSGLSEELSAQLADISSLKNYQAGEVIFEDGAPGVGFHLLAKGKVKIHKIAPDGREQILHLFGPGEPFGEVAIFTDRGYPASALALTEVTSVFIPKEALVRLISSAPEMALGLIGLMAQRLAHFTGLLEAITLKEAPARLAAFILELARKNENRVELSLTKTQLASLLGATPETISRSLGRLKNAGLISEEKPHIIIKDRPRLEQAAMGLGIPACKLPLES